MIEQKSFTFPFEDEDWIGKFLVGTLLYLISPILLFIPLVFVQGYVLRVWRDAVAGLPARLPEWEDWEDMGIRGLAYYVITLLYSLPIWILWTGVAAVFVGGVLVLISVSEEGLNSEASAVLPGVVTLLLIVGVGLLAVLALLVSLFLGLWLAVAVGRYLEVERFGAAFEFGAIWQALRANLEGLVVAWAILLGMGLLLGTLASPASAIPCCGPLLVYLLMMPFAFYVALIQARLMGQVYHEAQRRLAGAPTPPKEVPPEDRMPVVPEPVKEVEEGVVEELSAESVQDTLLDVPVPIETLGLSTRVQRILRDAGLTAVSQVVERLLEGDEELLSIPGLGVRSLDEIKTQLAAHGFLD